MAIQKLNSTRRVIASGAIHPAGGASISLPGVPWQSLVDSRGTYAWQFQNNDGTAQRRAPVPGEKYVLQSNNKIETVWIVNPCQNKINKPFGFIVDVEVPAGGQIYIGMVPNDWSAYNVGETIRESGRYVGTITPNVGTSCMRFIIEARGNTGKDVTISEAFFFDPDFDYNDFLVSPVDVLATSTTQDTSRVSMLQPRLGFAASIPTTGNWRLGDRVENLAWDGNLATPIAWVCTVGGNPGTWKAVTMFDSYGANKDPYGYSYIDGGYWIGANNKPVVGNGRFVFDTVDTTGYSYISQNNIPCIVPNEVIIQQFIILDNPQGNYQGVAAGNFAIHDISGAVNTLFSYEYTLPSNLTNIGILNHGLAASGTRRTMTVGLDLVRSKYPFLSSASPSFTGAPTALAYNAWFSNGTPSTWYMDGTFTYAAGALSKPGSGGTLYQKTPRRLRAGSTIRVRINVTAQATSPAVTILGWKLNAAGSDTIVNAATISSTGIKEFSGVLASDYDYIGIYFGAAGTCSFDYARIYTE